MSDSTGGWMLDSKKNKLIELCSDPSTQMYVEVGVYLGKSFLVASKTMADKNNLFCKAIAIDPWTADASAEGFEENNPNHKWWTNLNYDHLYKEWRDNLEKSNSKQVVQELRMTSHEASKQFEDESIDVFHLDGNHSEVSSTRDVEDWYSKVKRGKYFVFDDTIWPETANAQKVLLSKGYKLVKQCHEQDQGQGWSLYVRQ